MPKATALFLLLAGTLSARTIEDAMKTETREKLPLIPPPAPKVEMAHPRLASKRPVLVPDFAQAGAAVLEVETTQHRCQAGHALVVDSAGGEHWNESLWGFDRMEVSAASGD